MKAAPAGHVVLDRMTPAEFEAYLQPAIAEYAADKIAAGNWSEAEALSHAQRDFADLLPQGVVTPDQHLFTIRDAASARAVGVIWLAVMPHFGRPSAFIYDLRIFDAFQRRGYGMQAMLAVEHEAQALGMERIGLHVFGHNSAAQALYLKLGYTITNVNMVKHLAP
ncbi:MAG: GNAT family N-acetyltransferase [Anaerolineae bacterium]